MVLFANKVPERKWGGVVAPLGLVLRSAANKFYPAFLSHTAVRGLPPSLNDTARHYVSMLQLSATASTVLENGYASDPEFFLELAYIAITGRYSQQMHADIADYNTHQMSGDALDSLTAWASKMTKQLSAGAHHAILVTELVGHGALLVVQAKILTCEACGDYGGAEKVRRTVN